MYSSHLIHVFLSTEKKGRCTVLSISNNLQCNDKRLSSKPCFEICRPNIYTQYDRFCTIEQEIKTQDSEERLYQVSRHKTRYICVTVRMNAGDRGTHLPFLAQPTSSRVPIFFSPSASSLHHNFPCLKPILSCLLSQAAFSNSFLIYVSWAGAQNL